MQYHFNVKLHTFVSPVIYKLTGRVLNNQKYFKKTVFKTSSPKLETLKQQK